MLCWATRPRQSAVALVSSRGAAGAGTGESDQRYVWRPNHLFLRFCPFSHTLELDKLAHYYCTKPLR